MDNMTSTRVDDAGEDVLKAKRAVEREFARISVRGFMAQAAASLVGRISNRPRVSRKRQIADVNPNAPRAQIAKVADFMAEYRPTPAGWGARSAHTYRCARRTVAKLRRKGKA